MAKTAVSPILKHLRGKVGDLVFRRVHGKLVVSRTPDFSNYRPTPAQRAQRKRFRAGVAYARAKLASAESGSSYRTRARAENRSPFTLAISDYLRDEAKPQAPA
jgi:hypothetical protein